MRLRILLLGLPLLCSCASNAPEPIQGEPMNLEVINTAPQMQLTVIAYDDDYDCYKQRFVSQIAERFSSKRAALPKRRYQSFVYQYFGGGAEKTAGVPGGGISATTCTGAYTFPTAGGSNFRVLIDRQGTRCAVAVQRISETGQAETVIAIRREFTQPFLSDGPWCKADMRFQGSSSLGAPRGP